MRVISGKARSLRLKTAIETIYAFAITSEPSSLNKCKYCGKIYIPTNSKSQYCSPSCRNCSNVKKSRSRAKNDKVIKIIKELYNEGNE